MEERRDATPDRRRAQREVEERERLFRLLAENAQDIVYRYRLIPEPGFEYVSPAATRITGYTPEEHYADPQLGFKLVHPEDRGLLESMIGGRVPDGPVSLRWVRKDGRVVWTEQRNSAVLDGAGRLVAVEGIARDISQRKRAQDRLEAMLEVTRATLEQQPADTVISLVARHAMALAMGSTVLVPVPVPERDAVFVRVAVGRGAEALRGHTFPAEGSVATEVMRSGLPVRLEDVTRQRHPRLVSELGEIGPVLTVPMATAAGVFGALTIVRPAGGPPFSDDDAAVVTMFAEQASIVLEQARLREQLQEIAVLRDRERIARDLHDGVIQSLFGVGVSLQVAERSDGNARLVRSRVTEAMNDIDRLIVDVRNYIYQLRPTLLEQTTLLDAVRRLAHDLEQRHAVAVVVECDEEVPALLRPVAADVLHALREALSNVARHAGAQACRIALLREEDGGVCVSVEDDGRGFLPAPYSGHGLASLRERCAELGGSLQVASTPGEGTTVALRLPPAALRGAAALGAR